MARRRFRSRTAPCRMPRPIRRASRDSGRFSRRSSTTLDALYWPVRVRGSGMAESTVIFDLAALVRPAPTFRDADGVEYPFLAPDDFGFVEMARLQAAQETRTAARERYDADNTDVAAAEEHRAGLRQIMAVILPTLPDERRERLSD